MSARASLFVYHFRTAVTNITQFKKHILQRHRFCFQRFFMYSSFEMAIGNYFPKKKIKWNQLKYFHELVCNRRKKNARKRDAWWLVNNKQRDGWGKAAESLRKKNGDQDRQANNDKKYLKHTLEVSELWVCVCIEMLSEYQFFYSTIFLHSSFTSQRFIHSHTPRIHVALSFPLNDTLKHHRWINPNFLFVCIGLFSYTFRLVYKIWCNTRLADSEKA